MEDSVEDELERFKTKNTELAKENQSLKVLLAQKEREKLELTKELNELRLKFSRLRSTFAASDQKMESELQQGYKEVINNLVQASGFATKSMELFHKCVRERQEQDLNSPRWSHISSNSPKKVNEVPPLLLGGQSIQPVVSLSRTMLNNRSIGRSPNQSSHVTHRAVPMHMLQDVYIPLTRIDATGLQVNSLEAEENGSGEQNSAVDLGLEDNAEQSAEAEEENLSLQLSDLDEVCGLDAVMEDSMEQEEANTVGPSPQIAADNPLEGPSWLYDASNADLSGARSLEPDSTTRFVDTRESPRNRNDSGAEDSLAFTPTVRRRKRSSPPPAFSPRPTKRSVLDAKVVLMRLSNGVLRGSEVSRPSHKEPKAAGERRSRLHSRRSTVDSPPRRDTPRFDAPSPKGATARITVCETQEPPVASATRRRRLSSKCDSFDYSVTSSPVLCRSQEDSDPEYYDTEPRTKCTRKKNSHKEKPLNSEAEEPQVASATRRRRISRRDSFDFSAASSRDHSRSRQDSGDSDYTDAESRTRRTRKKISYKEKPLNRKLRR